MRWQRETASAQVEVTYSRSGGSPGSTAGEVPGIQVAVAATRQDRLVADGLLKRLASIRRATRLLPEHPQQAPAIMAQLRKMLPTEGWLTEQMSQLRATAHHVRDGHLAHLKEAKAWYDKLPRSAQKKATVDLAHRYRQLVEVDKRLERLDGAVAETELRIVRLTREAEQALSQGEHRTLADLLKAAERLQKHNGKLLKTIERTNEELLKLAEYVAPVATEGEAT